MIFRDDDISVKTDLAEFKKVDALFIKYKVQHHIAVIAEGIDQATELVEYINAHPHIVPQLHCWSHIDYTENHGIVWDHFEQAIAMMEQVFGKRPTVYYPPWNNVDDYVADVAKNLKMRVSHQKVSPSQYRRFAGRVGEDTLNFHYWDKQDQKVIESCLQIYKFWNP